MSAGLAASTVTPGITAPDASLTTPVMAPWAQTDAGTRTHVARAKRTRSELRMWPPDAELGESADVRVVLPPAL